MADEEDVQAPETDNPARVADQAAKPDVQTQDALSAEKVIAPDWPDDWRDKLTADDKLRKRLDRFQSPKDVLKAYTELERKLSSGEVKAKLPTDATEEQVTAWRKDNGIPEKPDGYLENLPKGLVIGDADKPLVEGFLASVHAENAPPGVVAKALDWYYGAQEQMLAAQTEADTTYRAQSEDALRGEWGGEYRANVKSINAFLDAAPATDDGTPLKALMLDARLGDGTRLGDNPAALKWLAGLAADANPAGFVAPGASQIDGVQTEIATIKKFMTENRDAYFKDEKMQARYRQLLAAEEKLSSR